MFCQTICVINRAADVNDFAGPVATLSGVLHFAATIDFQKYCDLVQNKITREITNKMLVVD